jgi:hypothetical protein
MVGRETIFGTRIAIPNSSPDHGKILKLIGDHVQASGGEVIEFYHHVGEGVCEVTVDGKLRRFLFQSEARRQEFKIVEMQ